jgi:chromosome segregation ATPase
LYELGEAREKRDQAYAKAQAKTLENESLKTQLETALTRIEELTIIKDQLSSDLTSSETKNDDLMEQITSLTDKVVHNEQERTATNAEVSKLKAKNL